LFTAIAASAPVRLPARHVVLQRGVAAGHLGHGLNRRLGERRPAKVGVHHDAGGVDDAPKRAARLARKPRGGVSGDRVGRDLGDLARTHGGTRGVERLAQRLQRERAPVRGIERSHVLPLEELVDLGQ
jgi:hypothetical protein